MFEVLFYYFQENCKHLQEEKVEKSLHGNCVHRSNINHPIFKWCSCSPYFLPLGTNTSRNANIARSTLCRSSLFGRRNLKEERSWRWVGKYFHIKCIIKEKLFCWFLLRLESNVKSGLDREYSTKCIVAYYAGLVALSENCGKTR